MAGTSTPRRPCSTRSRCGITGVRPSTAAGSRSSATSRTRVARQQQLMPVPRAGLYDITLVGPPTLMPRRLDGWPVTVSYDLDDVLPDIDVVYLLRIQTERISDARFPSIREYAARWGLTAPCARGSSPTRW